MLNLKDAHCYLSDEDYDYLDGFLPSDARSFVPEFCKKIKFSETEKRLLSNYPDSPTLRYCILLALAATKSDSVYNAIMYGFNITTRASDTLRINYYVDIDGINMIHICECWEDTANYEILFLNPMIFSEDYNYAVEAVLRICE